MTRTSAEGTDRPVLAGNGPGTSYEGSLSRRQRIRKLLPYAFAAGVLVSVCSAVIFYFLLKTLHNPLIFTEYWKNVSDQQWVSAYTAWQNTRFDYTMGYGISVLVALVSAGGIAVSRFPRGALVTSFVLLNVLYAWTAHVFLTISNAFGQTVINAMSAQDMFFWNFVNLRYGYSTLIVADIESLTMLATAVVLTFLLTLHNGVKKAILRSFQILAVCCMILGSEIYLFDGSEFNLHVTQVQASFRLAVWFSNADLLYTGLGLFVASTCMLYFPRLFAWRRAQTQMLSEGTNHQDTV